VGYEIDYFGGEQVSCSSKIVIADRIFYVKLFVLQPSQFFSGDQQGVIQKEISKAEFELWLSILVDNERDVNVIQEKLALGKKY
jgi:hypothetical protein